MVFNPSDWRYPAKTGLYDPALEHDACGVGFIVNIKGHPSHKIINDARRLSNRMEHRGAVSADNDTGDGAGAMVAMPDSFYRDLTK